MIRRLASLMAAAALAYAVALPPLSACEHSRGAAVQREAEVTSGHQMPGGSDALDCQSMETQAPQDHEADCVNTCLTMAGCSSPCFVADVPELRFAGDVPTSPRQVAHLYSGLTLPPDRPPPKA